MIDPHPAFQPPDNPGVPIWRYMSLSNFIWMLQNKALYFSRADFSGDPYEGYYTEVTALAEDDWVKGHRDRGDQLPEEVLRQSFKQVLMELRRAIRWSFVSCWHMNEEESQAMWRLYTPHGESIAIRSTYQLLADLLPAGIQLGCVRYIDYRTQHIEEGNVLNYIVHKRKSFEHERELRAVVFWIEGMFPPFEAIGDRKGVIVPVELRRLITEVFVSPNASPPLLPVVEGLVKTYGREAQVRQSGVNAPPPY